MPVTLQISMASLTFEFDHVSMRPSMTEVRDTLLALQYASRTASFSRGASKRISPLPSADMSHLAIKKPALRGHSYTITTNKKMPSGRGIPDGTRPLARLRSGRSIKLFYRGAASGSGLGLAAIAVIGQTENVGSKVVARDRSFEQFLEGAAMLGRRLREFAVQPIPNVRLRNLDLASIRGMPASDGGSRFDLATQAVDRFFQVWI